MTLRHAVRRIRCAIGLHRRTVWYAPTGRPTPPLYERRVECLWCLRRFE